MHKVTSLSNLATGDGLIFKNYINVLNSTKEDWNKCQKHIILNATEHGFFTATVIEVPRNNKQ